MDPLGLHRHQGTTVFCHWDLYKTLSVTGVRRNQEKPARNLITLLTVKQEAPNCYYWRYLVFLIKLDFGLNCHDFLTSVREHKLLWLSAGLVKATKLSQLSHLAWWVSVIRLTTNQACWDKLSSVNSSSLNIEDGCTILVKIRITTFPTKMYADLQVHHFLWAITRATLHALTLK